MFLLMYFPRDWHDNPETSSIERVDLQELDFPAITVCPEYATDAFAVRTILNMLVKKHLVHCTCSWKLCSRIEPDEKLKSLLPKTLLDMKRKLWSIPDNRDDVVYDDMEFGWITDFDNVDSVANVALRKTDLLNFAIFNEGNLYNNLF